MNNDQYSALIISYNQPKELERCILSMTKDPFCRQILLVDNGSDSRFRKNIESFVTRSPKVQTYFLNKNLGFGQASNLGLSKLYKEGERYVFLLNQDTYLHSETAADLVKELQKDTQKAIVSPMHLATPNGELDFWFVQHLQNSLDSSENSDLEFINAAAWMLDMERIYPIGGFNPLFFMYGEDLNLCQRIRLKGLHIGMLEDCFIIHDRIQSTKKRSLKTIHHILQGYWLSVLLDPAQEKKFIAVQCAILKQLAYYLGKGNLKYVIALILLLFTLLPKISKVRANRFIQLQNEAFWVKG